MIVVNGSTRETSNMSRLLCMTRKETLGVSMADRHEYRSMKCSRMKSSKFNIPPHYRRIVYTANDEMNV